jgi:putative ABC transport system permease protein
MLRLALQTLRGRRHGFVGAFVALAFAVALLTACGILVQSGAQGDARVDRYAATPIVIAGDDTMRAPLGRDAERVPLPEPRRLPAALGDRVAGVEGVSRVVSDRSIPATVATGGRVLAAPDGERVFAHGWSSAALAPYTFVGGRAPGSDAEVVLDARLATVGEVAVGEEVRIASTDGTRRYSVVGLARTAPAAPAAVFVTDALAARLAADPGQVDALGVLLDEGATSEAVAPRVRDVVGEQARVLTGDERGRAAAREDVRRNNDLVAFAGAFGGTAVILAIFVVAATLALSVLQRSREIALLRTIGAKPRQVRRLLIRETVVVALAAGLIALAPGVLLGAGLFHALRDQGIGAETTTLKIGWAPPAIALATGLVAACLAAWLAGRRASRIRPTVALAEAALEPRRVGWIRLLLGTAFLAGGVFICATAMSQQGDAGAEASVGVVMTLMVAVGLLGPLLARVAAAIAGPLIAAASSTSGFLAQASLRTRARRLAAASTPLALTVAFSVAVVGTLTVEAQATREQSRERVLADRVLTGPGGLPAELLGEVRALPGVTTVTDLLPTQAAAIVHGFDGTQFAFLPTVGVSPDGIDHTLDLDVSHGSLAALAPGTVALSDDRARSLRVNVGERVPLWLGDGHRIRPRVVATYASALGFGDIMLPRDTIAAHVADPIAAQALVTYDAADAATVDAGLRRLAGATPGVRVADPRTIQAEQADEAETNSWVNYLILGVLIAFCAIAVVNTLIMATAERSRELALLRLVGATATQVTRMLRWEALAVIGLGLVVGFAISAATLVPFSLAVADTPLPYLPVPFLLGVVALAAALGLAATELPARAALRQNPADVIGAGQ